MFHDSAMTMHIHSVDEMMAMGAAIARESEAGAVIGLVGDLGAGKTHWVKGFVAEIGCTAEVTSPTFGLVHEYAGGRLPVSHFDFYRLGSAEELIGLGWDEYLECGGVVVAEWADKFPSLMPAETRWFYFSIGADGVREVSERSLA
ncbi:MAG: tRNA ((37)-N6)-threonylcarbamoyltransferase complex ATPase subunit type 1 TsaE [Verrucomicrobiota bacterium]|jgi:tRNA threonylcarbamoyladenosine biosynthesis protein TsaE